MTPSRMARVFLLALALICQTTAILAVPANDNFAALPVAVLSPSGSPTSINNTGATLEAGEPIPGGFSDSTYQATAWWRFSPAAFDGWYQIETTGSAIDTVLAIWTGTDFSTPLTLVHVNDEATPGSGVSMIRFFAAASVSYKISVASRTAARGTVTLKAFYSGDGPFAEVTAAQFSPLAVNVGGAAASTTATLTIPAIYDIDSGLLRLFSPSGVVVATAPVSFANRPDDFADDYFVSVTLPANSAPGSYRWSVSLHTNTITSFPDASHGWEAMSPLPDGAPQTINVISDSYALWLTANGMTGTASVKTGDYDNDGSKNLVEFAFGSDPRADTQQFLHVLSNTMLIAGLPVVTTTGTGDQQRLRVEFVRRLNDPSLTYTVQFSDDLVNWSNATNAPVVQATNASFEAVAVEDVVSIPAKARRYGRVSVTQ